MYKPNQLKITMENTTTILNGWNREFTAPSGFKYTIREQNGADEDILSNPSEAANMMNISRFLAGIIVDTDCTPNRLMTAEDVHNLPVLDKWAILFNSRIHSLGNTLEFEYDWGKENGGTVMYEQNLEDYLFDYAENPTMELLLSKPDAIPYYPMGKTSRDIEFETSRGHRFRFDLLTSHGEVYLSTLPLEKRTKNQTLIARNLRLEVDGKWDKVTNFSMFSVKEMAEIRSKVGSLDPIFKGTTKLVNPSYPELTTDIQIVSAHDFFYLGEI